MHKSFHDRLLEDDALIYGEASANELPVDRVRTYLPSISLRAPDYNEQRLTIA